MKRWVTAVRPYQHEEHIRARVFRHLKEAGLVIREDEVIAPGTSDDVALQLMAQKPDDVFLSPFHAHRDAQGNQINGWKLVQRLDKELPQLSQNPILMPCTETSFSVVRATIGGDLARRVLLISENELDDVGLAKTIRDHVDPFFSR